MAEVKATLLGLAAAALALVACTHNPVRPASGWSANKTRNVTVYSDTLIEHRHPQEWLELSYAAFAHSFFRGLKLKPVEAMFLQAEPGSLTRVYWPNDTPPSSWTLERMPSDDAPIGKDGLVVLSNRNHGEAKLQMAHHFIAHGIRDAPVWLHLGFARYLSQVRIHYANNDWRACFGSFSGFPGPQPAAPGTEGRAVLVPLRDLFATDWYAHAAKGRHWYQYTAYAFVNYLVHGTGKWGASRFPVMLAALAEGKSTEEALAAAYPNLLLDELDEELDKYVRERRRRPFWPEEAQGLCFRIPPAHAADDKPQSTPVPEPQIRATLEDLKRIPIFRSFPSYYPAAVVEQEAAKTKKPGQPGTGKADGKEEGPLEIRATPPAP